MLSFIFTVGGFLRLEARGCMKNIMLDLLKENPIIAAVKDIDGLKRAIKSGCKVVFLLFGDICDIGELVTMVKKADKLAIVHIDLIDGLSSKDSSAKYISKNTSADGIISTKLNLIKTAKENGLITIQRVFVIDSLSFENAQKHMQHGNADFIEILPGIMPKIIKSMAEKSAIPIIAGGLIRDKEDVMSSLNAGAKGVSTTNSDIWH